MDAVQLAGGESCVYRCAGRQPQRGIEGGEIHRHESDIAREAIIRPQAHDSFGGVVQPNKALPGAILLDERYYKTRRAGFGNASEIAEARLTLIRRQQVAEHVYETARYEKATLWIWCLVS